MFVISTCSEIFCASFLHELEHVLFDVLVKKLASKTCIKFLVRDSCTSVTGITLRPAAAAATGGGGTDLACSGS